MRETEARRESQPDPRSSRAGDAKDAHYGLQ